jgi:hypothetical protein
MAQFLLQAIDPSLGCSILEAIMTVDDPEVLRSLLGADAEDVKDFSKYYILDQDEARSITERFSVQFDLISDEVHLSRWSFDEEPPYLIHTNFELLLMLDGRKPFSTFTISYPIEIGEDRIEALFEPHVQSGAIKKFTTVEPFESPIKGYRDRLYSGVRHIYYTLPGEEWRVEANRGVWNQLKFGQWNFTLERIWGTLLGYSESENNWWISQLRKRGREWGAISAYVLISNQTLTWVRASGCRALPWESPDAGVKLLLLWPPPKPQELDALMEVSNASAIIRLAVKHNFTRKREANVEGGIRSYQIKSAEIPELNGSLAGQIDIIAERPQKIIDDNDNANGQTDGN